MKRQRRARIIPPDWLNYEVLQKLLENEENNQPFAALPFQWLEISTALLERFDRLILFSAHCVSAGDDIAEPELTRRLLRDLREVRQAKARKGIETIGDTHLQMDNLGMMEINEIRFLNEALDRLRMMNTAKYNAEEKESVDSNDDFGSADDTWEN